MSTNPQELQANRNRQSRDAWDTFASHRDQTMAVIERMTTIPSNRICLLGAGNCNDVDLAQLCARFRFVHLVDLDETACRAAVARQPESIASACHVYPSWDLTGIAINDAFADSTKPLDIDELLHAATNAQLPPTGGEFDAVCSTCVLSQLIEYVTRNPAVADHVLAAVQAIRHRHLEMMIDLLRDGGTGILVMDIVSSATCRELLTLDTSDLPALLREQINRQNFFTGMNPAVIHTVLTQDPQLARRIQNVNVTSPWLWNLGPRTYAVCAIHFQRRHGAHATSG